MPESTSCAHQPPIGGDKDKAQPFWALYSAAAAHLLEVGSRPQASPTDHACSQYVFGWIPNPPAGSRRLQRQRFSGRRPFCAPSQPAAAGTWQPALECAQGETDNQERGQRSARQGGIVRQCGGCHAGCPFDGKHLPGNPRLTHRTLHGCTVQVAQCTLARQPTAGPAIAAWIHTCFLRKGIS